MDPENWFKKDARELRNSWVRRRNRKEVLGNRVVSFGRLSRNSKFINSESKSISLFESPSYRNFVNSRIWNPKKAYFWELIRFDLRVVFNSVMELFKISRRMKICELPIENWLKTSNVDWFFFLSKSTKNSKKFRID